MIAMYQRSHLVFKMPGRWGYYSYLFFSEKETECQRDSCPRSLSYWVILISSPEKAHAWVCPPVCMGHVDPCGRSPAKKTIKGHLVGRWKLKEHECLALHFHPQPEPVSYPSPPPVRAHPLWILLACHLMSATLAWHWENKALGRWV